MSSLPYITAPGNIERALKAIKSAAQPEKVTQDFVKTILQIKGGSGNQVTSFLKKIGFTSSDGTPTEIYKKFRNSSTSGMAAAEALKVGYKALYTRNEYMHKLSDEDLRGLIIEETGQSSDSGVIGMVLASVKAVGKFAEWDTIVIPKSESPVFTKEAEPYTAPKNSTNEKENVLGMNLSYTINLNLPATSDPAVFNAIFKSLKENLLRSQHEL